MLRAFFASLPYSRFESNVALRSSTGVSAIIDAIAETPKENFLIEVKTGGTSRSYQYGFDQLRRYLALYDAMAPSGRPARGILVVPRTADIETAVGHDVAVLKYDEETMTFENAEEVFQ